MARRKKTKTKRRRSRIYRKKAVSKKGRGRPRKRGRPKKTTGLRGRGRPRKRGRPKKTQLEKGEKSIKKIRIRLIGIGGGGNSIVSEIAQRIKGATFYAINSDVKALNSLGKKVKRLQFGEALTHGLGTGTDPIMGEEIARQERDKIKEILEGQDLVILVACLGGGLGSGAAPVFARISKNLNNLTYGIFTLPFKFEGEKKMDTARKSLEKLKTELNAFSVIPNERIFHVIDRSAPLKKALSAINKHLTNSIQSLIEIIYKAGIINIDFADLRTIFDGKGKLTYLNSMELSKEDDKDALDKIINYPIYPYGIDGAKGVVFNISGQRDLSLLQVNQISQSIAKLVSKEAKIIFGVSRRSRSSKIKISLLATGCNGKDVIAKLESKIQPKIVKKQIIKKKDIKKIKPLKKKRKIKIKVEKPKISILEKTPQASLTSDLSDQQKQNIRVRKNALQIKKEIENEEADIVSKERLWERPAFLRKKSSQD